jgi:hypothetical protein
MRKEKIVEIIDDGNLLTFKIKQMSAIKQERWINKVLILAAGANVLSSVFSGFNINKISNSFKDMNLNKFMEMFGKLDYEKVEPLYEELLECCSHIPDKNNVNFATPLNSNNADSIISDFKTLYKLRFEALKLNFSFFKSGAKSPNQKTADITYTKRM